MSDDSQPLASRRQFLTSAGAGSAGLALSPLVAAGTQAAPIARPLATAGNGLPDKAQELARDTSRDAGQVLTTNQGLPIADNQNTLKAGERGPALLEDHILRDKITHFDHERIPERVVHARGAAAHGHFQVYESLAPLCKAKFLQDPRKKTPVFVRFSTVAGSRGSADTARDVRGFATRFYTEEGNYDLVGNNIPVFFIQDAIKFPDLIHAAKPEADREIPQASTAHDTFWDFISLMPESTHMIMWIMSDRAIPRSYRMMEGFGVHTFRLVNERGVSRFVKFHWKPLNNGVHGLAWDEAQKLGGKDPDFHRRDLADAIAAGHFPEWELCLQVVEEADAGRFDFDLLDPTKLIPEEVVPVRRIGRMTLDRNPDNYFAETEQVAYHPGNLVPGIDHSNDPLLQGRLFSYVDTQLTRLGGPNFHEIPINRPICPFHNMQRDGFHRQTIAKGRVNYQPSSIDQPPVRELRAELGGFASLPEPTAGPKLRMRAESFADHYSQASLFWRSQTAPEQQHIIEALQFELGKVAVPSVRLRMLSNLVNVDPALASAVAVALGVAVPVASAHTPLKTYPPSPALSMSARGGSRSIQARVVAVLAADGIDADSVQSLRSELGKAGAKMSVLSTRLGELRGRSGGLAVDHLLVTMPSVVFDAVYVPGGRSSVDALMSTADAVHFVREAFKHAKAIGATGEGRGLLAAAGVAAPGGEALPAGLVATAGADREFARAFMAAIAAHRHWGRASAAAMAA